MVSFIRVTLLTLLLLLVGATTKATTTWVAATTTATTTTTTTTTATATTELSNGDRQRHQQQQQQQQQQRIINRRFLTTKDRNYDKPTVHSVHNQLDTKQDYSHNNISIISFRQREGEEQRQNVRRRKMSNMSNYSISSQDFSKSSILFFAVCGTLFCLLSVYILSLHATCGGCYTSGNEVLEEDNIKTENLVAPACKSENLVAPACKPYTTTNSDHDDLVAPACKSWLDHDDSITAATDSGIASKGSFSLSENINVLPDSYRKLQEKLSTTEQDLLNKYRAIAKLQKALLDVNKSLA